MASPGLVDAGAIADADRREDAVRMLIVEDDPQVSEALGHYFELEEYEVMLARDGATALELMRRPPGFDIVLMDVILPRGDGFEVLRASHQMGIHSPVLMMSGRGGEENILKSIGLGARDFLLKPFDPADLMEKVHAILGSTRPPENTVRRFSYKALVVNLTTYEAFLDGDLVKLTQLEFDLLRSLILNRGQVVSRKRLLRDAWGIDQDVISYAIDPEVASERLDESIESLRDKIEQPDADPIIETVYGQGYRLNA